jgi:hypothetical protein
MIATLTEAYDRGEPGPGEGVTMDWDNDGAQPWTGVEMTEAFSFALLLFLYFAWEAEAAWAQGRPPDAAAFLQRQALFVAAHAPQDPLQDKSEIDLDIETPGSPE